MKLNATLVPHPQDTNGQQDVYVHELGTAVVDSDSDGVLDDTDNCVNTANADQADNDNDGAGDVCDPDDDDDGISDIDEIANGTDPFDPDITPPTITASRAPASGNANGWNNSDVTVSYTAADTESGIDASASDLGDDIVGEGENQTAEGTAVDNAGNSASASISGINVDKTDPVVTFADQLAKATSETGVAVVYSGVSATDAMSGIDTFICDTPSGSTFPVGVTDVDCTATDLAGNSSSGGFTVVVVDQCDCTKGVGFWKKQFSDKGKQQIEDSTLQAYLDIVDNGSGFFGAMTLAQANDVFNPPKSNNRGGNDNTSRSPSRDATNESATGKKKGGSKAGDSNSVSSSGTNLSKKQQNAEKQVLAAWLNFAKGAIDWDEMIDTDGDGVPDTEFGVLIATIEDLMSQGDYEAAKDLAESVNQHDKDNPDCETGTRSGSETTG